MTPDLLKKLSGREGSKSLCLTILGTHPKDLAEWMLLNGITKLDSSHLKQFKNLSAECVTSSSQALAVPQLSLDLSALSWVSGATGSLSGGLAVPLSELIAKSADFKPGDPRFNSLETLQEVLNTHSVSSKRFDFVEQNLRSSAGFQFKGSKKLVLRELVANALDSYYYSPALRDSVNLNDRLVQVTTPKPSQIQVEDAGLGMSLNDVVFSLFRLGASSNPLITDPTQAIQGMTGRYGVGFFSVLSYLVADGDEVVIETHKEGFSPIRVILTKKLLGKKEPELFIRIEGGQRSQRGTQIRIQSSLLTPDAVTQFTQEVIPKYFKNTQAGRIQVAGTTVTGSGSSSQRRFRVPFNTGDHVTVTSSGTVGNIPNSTVRLEVNGVLIQELVSKGDHVYPEVTIDFPSQTRLTPDRNTFIFNDKANQAAIKSVVDYAVEQGDLALLNTLYPALTDEGFNNLSKIKLTMKTVTLPADPTDSELQSLHQIQNQKVQFIRPELFKKIVENPLNVLDSTKSLNFQDKLFGSAVSDSKQLLHFSSADSRNSGRQIFLDQHEQLDTQYSIPITNTILETREVLGEKPSHFKNPFGSLAQLDPNVEIPVEMLDKLPAKFFDQLNRKYSLGFLGLTLEERSKYFKLLYQILHARSIRVDQDSIESFFETAAILRRLLMDRRGLNDLKWRNMNIFRSGKEISEDDRILDRFEKLQDPTIQADAARLFRFLKKQKNHPQIGLAQGFFDNFNSSMFEKFEQNNKFALGEYLNYFIEFFESTLPKSRLLESNSYEVPSYILRNIFVTDLQAAPKLIEEWGHRCIHSKLKYCNRTIFEQFDILYEFQKNHPELVNSLFNYFDHFYSDDLLGTGPNWEFKPNPKSFSNFITFLLAQDYQSIDPAVLRFFHQTGKLLNPFSWENNFSKITFSSGQLQSNHDIVLKKIFHDYKHKSPVDTIKLLDSFKSIDRYNPEIRSSPTLDAFYSAVLKEDLINYESIPYVYAYFFGGKEDFLEEHSQAGEELRSFHPLEDDPELVEVMGNSSELNRKNIITAIQQNPVEYAWVRELLKNSQKAGATEIHLDVLQNENKEIVVRLKDNGKGRPPEERAFFFIPKYTSATPTSDDINFGWGLFTLFNTFHQLQIESSSDGVQQSNMVLRADQNGRVEISKETKVGKPSSFPIGTTLTFKKKGEADLNTPVFIRGHISQVVGDMYDSSGKPILLSFNGKAASESSEFSFQNKTALVKQPVLLSSNGTHLQLNGYSLGKKGIYYNGLLHSIATEPYLEDISSFVKKKMDALEKPLAVNMIGHLAQNSTRTEFLNQDELTPHLKEVFSQTALRAIALQNGREPSLIQYDLPYDFYYDFQLDSPLKQIHEIQETNQGRSYSEIAKNLKTPAQLAAYISSLPLGVAQSHEASHPSLLELKLQVEAKLKELGIIGKDGSYLPGAPFNPGALMSAIKGDLLQPQLRVFEEKISKHMNILKHQQEGGYVGILGVNRFSEALRVASSHKDFSIQNIPLELAEVAPTLKKMSEFLVWQAQKIFGKKVKINFYSENDGTLAHDWQGTKYIAFNIKGNHVVHFQKMLMDKRFDFDFFLKIMSTLAHEIVHSEEVPGSTTHDKAFIKRQQVLLEKLFQFNHNPGLTEELEQFFK